MIYTHAITGSTVGQKFKSQIRLVCPRSVRNEKWQPAKSTAIMIMKLGVVFFSFFILVNPIQFLSFFSKTTATLYLLSIDFQTIVRPTSIIFEQSNKQKSILLYHE